jgi:hypothetical protein
LLQEIPAIDRLIQLDSRGIEHLRATRRELVRESGTDYSGNPRFTALGDQPGWLSPAYFDGPDPFISTAIRIPAEMPVRPSPR